MATQDRLHALKNVLEKMAQIDRNGLMRPNIGTESLEKELTPRMDRLAKIQLRIEKNAPEVSDEIINQVIPQFDGIRNAMETQARRQSHEYIQQKASFLTTFDAHVEALLRWTSYFTAAAIEKTGILDGETLEEILKKNVEEMKRGADEAIKKIGEQSRTILEAVEQQAKAIEEGARRVATGVSVRDAQKQFEMAQIELRTEIRVWGTLSSIFVAIFLGSTLYFLDTLPEHLPNTWTWQLIYYTAIRITLLSGLAAVASFCLKMMKRSVHLAQRNKHRQHIANSMDAFVNSAFTAEQRDSIFGMMVRSVISYSDADETSEEDPIQVARIPQSDSVQKAAIALVSQKAKG